MNWQIFFSTFILIFLAELGDKTQLAAMARAASDGSARWTIFFAASLALVLSTLVAVLLGDTLTRVIPERYIRAGAGILFVIFGLVLLREAFVRQAYIPAAQISAPGAVTRFVFKQAAAFEEAARDDYLMMADKTADPRLRQVLEELAREEDNHLKQINTYAGEHAEAFSQHEALRELSGDEKLVADAAKQDRPLIQHAIEHEAATANFYRELAHLTPLPPLRKAFQELADAEQQHLVRLQSLLS